MLQRYVFSVRKNALRSQVNEQDRIWMFGPGNWVGKKQRLADGYHQAASSSFFSSS
jgi:hypothetical protein